MLIPYSILFRSIISPLAICIGTFTAFNFLPVVTRQSVPITCFSGSFRCLKEVTKVELLTTKGKIIVTLFHDSAPLTTGSFIDLVKHGAYNGTPFLRVIRELKPFVVHVGEIESTTTTEVSGYHNVSKSIVKQPRILPMEITLEDKKEPLYGKSVINIENMSRIKSLHNRGTLAMSHSQDSNSVGSPFYIVLRPLPELDGRYTVFGQVIEGMDILDKIEEDDHLIQARVL
ncbi:probable peptidyl-prolyl cis-trans isomerase, cyclophilin type (chromatophore) [Paulinella micropora]|uniref:Peptidyl-prolyl cis-trans isomerase n=1 Tax=Paulinella micropora TaxID=1928728 RepID=A0A1L5YAV8_9EUKA|nr:putative peptidyl-prolyl cis-trans isomerase, cyclophilin type [Paulinella micropora]AQX44605.1 putative peptidyl-prolyl cis-trans isomerase, cyclophilin type [Paulinella micropora]BBL86683.1 probable peptidyl-prolyl cis-trans isomerase, cyclophilin type [Paulinella micropora]